MTWDEFSRLNLKSSVKEETIPSSEKEQKPEEVKDNNSHISKKNETPPSNAKEAKVQVVEYTFDSEEESESESESENETEQKPSDQLIDISEIETCAKVLHLWGYIVRFEGCQERVHYSTT